MAVYLFKLLSELFAFVELIGTSFRVFCPVRRSSWSDLQCWFRVLWVANGASGMGSAAFRMMLGLEGWVYWVSRSIWLRSYLRVL